MQAVHDQLQNLDIPYDTYHHPAVFSVDDAAKVRIDVTFAETKNLFLRNKKGTRHYLVSLTSTKQLDLKKFAETIGEKNISFASEERLKKYLGLTPGSVSPFGLLNDSEHAVSFYLDRDLLNHKHIAFHPNINTQTIVLSTKDFLQFLCSLGRTLSTITI